MMTKSINKEKLDKYMTMTKQKVAEGRAKESLKVKRAATTNTAHDQTDASRKE